MFGRKIIGMCAILATLFASQGAWANYFCSGTITDVSLTPSGSVFFNSDSNLGLQWQAVCTLGTTQNGVSPDACKAIYATLLTAKTSGKTVEFGFSDALSCTGHPAWTLLATGSYNSGGWYWGPVLSN